jgi:large subunit ribosomal protein L20
MPRVKRGVPSRRRHKKILKLAKGFRMTHRTLFRPANEAVLHALEYAYRDRRVRKRDMRKLWIARINAASRSQGMPYNQFMHGLKLAGVNINRKMLAELAVRDSQSFSELIAVARGNGESAAGGAK